MSFRLGSPAPDQDMAFEASPSRCAHVAQPEPPVSVDDVRVVGTDTGGDNGGRRSADALQQLPVGSRRDVGKQDTLSKLRWAQQLKRPALGRHKSREPRQDDRGTCLADRSRIEIDCEHPACVGACPRLGEQPGTASDVDGVGVWQQRDRGQAHLRRWVTGGAESVARRLDELGLAGGCRGVTVGPPVPAADHRGLAVGPLRRDRDGSRRERAVREGDLRNLAGDSRRAEEAVREPRDGLERHECTEGPRQLTWLAVDFDARGKVASRLARRDDP